MQIFEQSMLENVVLKNNIQHATNIKINQRVKYEIIALFMIVIAI